MGYSGNNTGEDGVGAEAVGTGMELGGLVHTKEDGGLVQATGGPL